MSLRREPPQQLRNITDNLAALICYQDHNGRFQFVNKTAQAWFAKNESELLGRTVPETMPEEYVAAAQSAREERIQGPGQLERTIIYPDGVTRTTETTTVPDVGEHGVVRGYYTLAVDVTARKAAEADLKIAHDTLASAFNSSSEAMFVVQAGETPGQGRILDSKLGFTAHVRHVR